MKTSAGVRPRYIDQVRPQFFGIAPALEAKSLDPQQRMLDFASGLGALEHAGRIPDQLTGSKQGVFVGIRLPTVLQQIPAARPTA